MGINRYDLAIFDLDGTLLDTTEGILSSAKYTIKKMGLEALDDKALSGFIGPPIQDSFAEAYGLSGPILQDIATIFRNVYSTEYLLLARAYDGIFELFEELCHRGIRIAVATYKREDYALELLRHFGFDRYTDIMFGGDHENKLKKKDIIEKCITVSGVRDRSRIVMVGDTRHDAIGAKGMGVDFLGVSYGFGFKNSDDAAEYDAIGCADTCMGMLKYFEQ